MKSLRARWPARSPRSRPHAACASIIEFCQGSGYSSCYMTDDVFDGYSLRPASDDDLAQVLEIENKSYPLPWTAEAFTQELEKPYSSFLVLTDDETDSKAVTLPALLPGYHSVIIEGFDKAGNSLISTFSFSILAFDKPIFTEYPSEINEEVIPVVRGTTRPGAEVTVTVSKSGAEPTIYNLTADGAGVFTLIPDGTFSSGVYELTARAKDQFGAQSEISETIKIAVQQPGYIQVGTFLISILSVVVPLIGLLALLVLSVWFLVIYLRRFRSRVSVESKEAVAMLDREFGNLEQVLRREKELLTNAHKTKKLTKVEEDMFTSLNMTIKSAQMRIMKEVVDVEKLVQKKK